MRVRLPHIAVRPSTFVYVAVALAATLPAWIVKYPPIQDLPFHLATIRVIHDFHNPSFGFDQHFMLTFGRTQYVFYYLFASGLSYLLGVVGANVVMMSLYLGGTVLALRNLLQALNKDERLCLFVVPLLVNVMFLFGLLPFLLGVPILLLALASAARYFERPSLREGTWLGVLALSLFFSHIFPFGLFGLGFAFMFPWSRPRQWLRSSLPVVPSLAALAWWTLATESGKLTRGALIGGQKEAIKPPAQALGDAYSWVTNVFQDPSDDLVFVAFILLALLAVGLSQGDPDRSKGLSRRYAIVPALCVFLYFNTSEGHGYIWLISQRFPILALITAIPLLRIPKGWPGWVVTAAAVALGAASLTVTATHFIKFQLEDVGDFDQALAQMEPRKKVAALIYDRSSSVTNWAPFLHFGSYYQLQKGGVVQFTYAGYLHWPFDFRPGHYPPPGTGSARLRWEWTPEQVSVQGELYPYYDYVLTRGSGFFPPRGTFDQAWRGDRWTVWKRHDGPMP